MGRRTLGLATLALMASVSTAAIAQTPETEGEIGIGVEADAQALTLPEPQPVSPEDLANPPAADWLSFRRDLKGWGHSPLEQITADNVSALALAWSRPLAQGSYEGTPLVRDGVMYIVQPSDVFDAVDAATGDLIWHYQRRMPDGFRGANTKRNAALFENLLISTSADGVAYALDIKTGELVWEQMITDWKTQSASTSGGPIIAGDKIVSGRNCAVESAPETCVIVANDARTGKELWRTNTMAAPGEPGDESWGGVPWEDRRQVGTWMPATYDAELDLVYIGTSVTGPTTKFKLGGNDKQHLYSTSTLALDGKTGKIVWYYQHLIDHWDFDHVFTRLLVDTAVAPDPEDVEWINPNLKPGEMRKVLTGIPGKTGIVYTLDRETGEFLWATPTIRQNVVADIDGATGKVTENPEVVFTAPAQAAEVCPSFAGGKNWMEGSYSPDTGLMYMPLQNLCSTIKSAKEGSTGAVGMGITNIAKLPEGESLVGQVQAISASTGKTAWTYRQRAGMMSVMSSAGGVVFAGDAVGRFKALDAASGEKLWEVNLGTAVGGYPISFEANGEQYVAVGTGLSPEAFTLMMMTPEYKPGMANTLFVFKLPKVVQPAEGPEEK